VQLVAAIRVTTGLWRQILSVTTPKRTGERSRTLSKARRSRTIHLVVLEPDQQDTLGYQLQFHKTLFAWIRWRRFTQMCWDLSLLSDVGRWEWRGRLGVLFGWRFV
jgi:hypothetical protein